MIAAIKYFRAPVFILAGSILLMSFLITTPRIPKVIFPYRKAGLTEQQAAAHLLSRFTYGATPGQVNALVQMGLENWFEQQLEAKLPDDSLNRVLSTYDALQLSNEAVINTYPKGAQVLRMAIKDGVIDKDSVNKSDKKEYRSQLQAYMQQQGLKPQQELLRQFISQKILRASLTGNQLQEVLTDFWFNHFNVSFTKNDCAQFIPAYERDVIRPNVLGRFEDLLVATAKSPAMLYYLDNFTSTGSDTGNNYNGKRIMKKMQAERLPGDSAQARIQKKRKAQGLNENYAREVMELHTLGVDGGYTQQDVTQAARVLTGWTVYPIGNGRYGKAAKLITGRVGEDNLAKSGFVHEGDFLFAANRHDPYQKLVLGKHFAAGGGYEEGVKLFQLLAHHPATAKFIAAKLAVRFVSDHPQQSLIDKMAKSFTAHDGNIRQVLLTMAASPEFWSAASVREKTKSPFELAISAVRSLNATVSQPYQLYNWINKMGQKLYYYQAPTGFPDKGQYWINTGALLNRMNFGLALASQRIPGVTIDLMLLNQRHEPESAEAALAIYGRMMMPERDLAATQKRLAPLLNDPALEHKVDVAAAKLQPDTAIMADEAVKAGDKYKKPGGTIVNGQASAMLSQVVGIIIGSPEFQRR